MTRSSRLPLRRSAVWPAAILVATALAFLPLSNLPSFDTPKLALLLVAAAALSVAVWRRRPAEARDDVLFDPILALPLLMCAVAAVGAVVAWPRGSLVGAATALGCVAVARLVAQSDDPKRAVRTVARGAALAALAAGLYGAAQSAGFDFAPWRGRGEPVSTFGNTSFAAEFQAAALPLSLLLLTTSGKRDRALGAVAALAGAAHLVLAKSRTDYVAVLAALGAAACLLLHARGRTRAAAGLAVGGVVAATALAFVFVAAAHGDGPSWLGRADTVAVRADVWRPTVRMIADRPFHVAGASFIDEFPAWRSPDEFRTSLGRRVETPHDDYLELGVALGAPGLLAAVGVLALLTRRLVAAARTHASETVALGASIAAVAVSALASSPLSHPATALLLAACAGLVVALAPQPWRGATLPARRADVALAVALVIAFWPGPGLRSLRSDGFLALARDRIAEKPARALELFGEACAVDPQAFDARYELGCLLDSVGGAKEAVRTLESARRVRPGDPECLVSLAYALRNAKRRPDADRVLDDAVARCPWHPNVLAARAIFALEDGRTADARADAQRAAAGLPTDPRLTALAAEAALACEATETTYAGALDALLVLFDRGETEEFGRSARSMLRRDRTLLGPLVTRARRLVPTKPGAAAALVLAAASGVKDDAGFLDDASRVLKDTGRAEESKLLLGRSLGVRAGEALARGQDEKALRLAGKALEHDPSSAHYLLSARAAAKLGERDAAVEDIGAAVAAGVVDPDAVRRDPILSGLLPNRRLEDVLDRAARRFGEKGSADGGR